MMAGLYWEFSREGGLMMFQGAPFALSAVLMGIAIWIMWRARELRAQST